MFAWRDAHTGRVGIASRCHWNLPRRYCTECGGRPPSYRFANAHRFRPARIRADAGDVRNIAESNILIVNGSGFEEFLNKPAGNAGRHRSNVQASKGLTSRALKPNEPHDKDNPNDPHFWFDPTKVVKYVENIRDGLTQADPGGAAVYQANADAYIQKLNALDARIERADEHRFQKRIGSSSQTTTCWLFCRPLWV